MKSTFRRTRLAPTPSGYLHLGNAFSFAVTVALARRMGAKIFLRIDDLDRERVKREYVEDIFETLDYLGLPWDEGPRNGQEYEAMYSQIHRMDAYQKALQQLREQGLVFACDCSRSMIWSNHPEGIYTGTCRHKGLPLATMGYNWRLDTAAAGSLKINGLDGNAIQTALPLSMRDVVVRKRNGFPAYQLASLVDDVHFGVDFIVRGVDLWESTLVQTHLAGVLGYESFLAVRFHHHALLMADAHSKLSKSAGSTSIQYLRRQHKTKADIYRMMGELAGLPAPLSSWEELSNTTCAWRPLEGDL